MTKTQSKLQQIPLRIRKKKRKTENLWTLWICLNLLDLLHFQVMTIKAIAAQKITHLWRNPVSGDEVRHLRIKVYRSIRMLCDRQNIDSRWSVWSQRQIQCLVNGLVHITIMNIPICNTISHMEVITTDIMNRHQSGAATRIVTATVERIDGVDTNLTNPSPTTLQLRWVRGLIETINFSFH